MNAAPNAQRRALLSEIAADSKQRQLLRAEAIAGLAGDAAYKDQLVEFATGTNATLRMEAVRALVEIPLSDVEKARLPELKFLPAAARLLGKKLETPALDDMDAWLELLEGDGDPRNGRRVFFHTKVGYCSRCHRYEGRGNQVGPDLSRIAQRGDQKWMLTAILHPSRDVAPAYRQWRIELKDGTEQIGIALRKGSHSEDYLGADGKQFTVKLADVESRDEIETSMMPEGLAQTLTAKELRDVMAFLLQR
jgi:putative heme-binding domain-containing protein